MGSVFLGHPEYIYLYYSVFRLLTDFFCLLTYEFCLSLWKIARCSVILLLPLFIVDGHRGQTHKIGLAVIGHSFNI
jgi:hypothetical protein